MGIAIKPDTDVLELIPYLSFIDLVLIMSVEPGAGGQSFLPNSPKKLADLQKIRKDSNLSFKIEMDGGINIDTISLVKDLDIAVIGSYICKSDNYKVAINSVKAKLKE